MSHCQLLLRSTALACIILRSVNGGAPLLKETVFEGHIQDIKWLKSDARTLLIQTEHGTLHQSPDSGQTWKNITEDVAPGIKVASLVMSPVNSNIVLAVVQDGDLYLTTDAAKSWRKVNFTASGILSTIRFHSSKASWALVSYWTSACGLPGQKSMPGDERKPCAHIVYVTNDTFQTFKRVATHIVQFSWGEDDMADRVFFSQFKDRTVAQPLPGRWVESIDFGHTDDFGVTVEPTVRRGNRFVVSHGFIMVAQVVDEKTQEVILMVSSEGGENFEPIVIPSDLRQLSYNILDTSEGAVALFIDHGGGVGHIYISDSTGVRYSLALKNNVYARGRCAFEKVANVRGIYIANVDEGVAPTTGSQAELDMQDPSMFNDTSTQSQTDRTIRYLQEGRTSHDVGPVSSKDRAVAARRLGGTSHNPTKVKTVISFDKGGAWTYLKPPEKDSLGQPVDCPPETCSLHLHAMTDDIREFVPVYSYKHALGILMATGNVGQYLTYDRSSANTYISRDGGLTWQEVCKGVYIYEFGNQGGLLIRGNYVEPTTSVSYSWNEGESWVQVPMPVETELFVANILTEPRALSTNFVLYGIRNGYQGVVVHIDFSSLHERECEGMAAASSKIEKSDYEHWTPSDGSDERCILGHQIWYVRRKRTAECFNPEKQNYKNKVLKTCKCSERDYECEVGFYRAAVGDTRCNPEDDDKVRDPALESERCGQADAYYVDAYRRVAGDLCIDGWRPPKYAVHCKFGNRDAKDRTELVQTQQGGPSLKVAFAVFSLIVGVLLIVSQLECTKAFVQRRFGSRVFYSNVGATGVTRFPAGAPKSEKASGRYGTYVSPSTTEMENRT